MAVKACVSIFPRHALVDEPVRITVTQLRRHQQVTVWLRHRAENGVFLSWASFTADTQGSVDLSAHEALSGSYKGVDPMGLFWSLAPSPDERPGLRLMKRDVTTPLIGEICVTSGHVAIRDCLVDPILANGRVYRWYHGIGVQRIPVQSGRLQATLFLPPGDGPFPGVIDLFGMIGGLVEYKAALMASRGFATMALAYFGMEGLPMDLTQDPLEIEYFDEAIAWLIDHPKVMKTGIGVVAVSKGCELAMTTATHNPLVRGIVSINGVSYLQSGLHTYREEILPFAVLDVSDCPIAPNGGLIFEPSFCKAYGTTAATIKVEQAVNTHFLFLTSSGDDQVSPQHSATLVARLREHGRTNYRMLLYPGAGHLLEPPYAPLCDKSRMRGMTEFASFGGEVGAHAVAQEDAWKQTLAFLRNRLCPDEGTGQLPPSNYIHTPEDIVNYFEDPANDKTPSIQLQVELLRRNIAREKGRLNKTTTGVADTTTNSKL